ncbi:LysR family transcriptional regulator [Pelomonas sp. APW6]|uniref:LysR family transcriptional regulator n=1 Tax=Roseateles subflavus TaxID=3053353 RepID=A0ABT7LJT0_9BURK|nr:MULTISPECIES: LysR family transcriptional regulator [unclassified Roseateles]MDL5032532.1 LysR family transcriptional regulator [Pelomonas sp. APW6]
MQPKSKALLGRVSDIDLRLLRVFKAVADCGGMAAAELELNIAMSTISRHIKDLEERLGLVLCRRGRAGFALSPEGERVYAAAEHLLSATESFRSSLHDIHRGLGGELHVALFEKTATNPAARIPQAIARFRDVAPEVELHLHVGSITMIEQGVMGGQFLLGIIPEHRRSESLAYDELFDEVMKLYAAPGHPWFAPGRQTPGWKDLGTQALAGLGYHSPNMMLAHEHRLTREATASDQEGVATLVLSGGFVGFLPDHYADTFVQRGQMRAVAPRTLNYSCRFSCVHRRAPALSRAAQIFRDVLIEAHQR